MDIGNFSSSVLLLLIDLKRKIKKSTIIVGNFDTYVATDKDKKQN